MANGMLSADDFRIPSRPPGIERLRDVVAKPEDIEDATRQLGLTPHLFNLHMATVVDLSFAGIGQTIYIPVQVTDREGGRKSLYFLDVDEEVLAGIHVRDLGILQRYVKRTSGHGTPAQSGDTYSERLATVEGTTLFESSGPLEVIDPEKGQGAVRLSVPDSDIQARTTWWILWSMFYDVQED